MEKLGVKMRSVTIASTVLISLVSFSVSAAYADMTPSAPPTISTDNYKAALEQYKHERDFYLATLRDRATKMSAINMLFKSAVDKLNIDTRNSLNSATTPTQKSAITAARRNAIDAAITARDLAIAALGPMPTPPPEPIRQPKGMEMNDRKEKKRN
jgi:hypothetical protein